MADVNESDFLTRAGHLAMWSFREADWNAEGAAGLLWEALRTNGATRFLHARLREDQQLEEVTEPAAAEYWLIDHGSLPAIALPFPTSDGNFRRLAPLFTGEALPREELKLHAAELEAIEGQWFRMIRPGHVEPNPLHRVAEAFKHHCRHAGPRLAQVVAFTKLLQERCGPDSNCLEVGAELDGPAEVFSVSCAGTSGHFWLARAGTYYFVLPEPRPDGAFARWLEAFGPPPAQARIIAQLAPLAVEPLPEPGGAVVSLTKQRFAVPQILARMAAAETNDAPPVATIEATRAAQTSVPPPLPSYRPTRGRWPRTSTASTAPAVPAHPPPPPPRSRRALPILLIVFAGIALCRFLVWRFAADQTVASPSRAYTPFTVSPHAIPPKVVRATKPDPARPVDLPADPAAFLAAFCDASAGKSPRSESLSTRTRSTTSANEAPPVARSPPTSRITLKSGPRARS